MDNVEMAQDSMEKAHAHAAAPGHGEGATRRAAVLVAVLAAVAVLAEMSANDAQTGFLAGHVAVSDLWTQYQAKSVRRTVLGQSAEVMSSDPQAAVRVARARSEAARMESEPGGDGMAQLAERAHERERDRDRDFHLFGAYERSVRGLQIAIVLVGLFLVTRMRWLEWAGLLLGGIAAAYAVAVGLGLA